MEILGTLRSLALTLAPLAVFAGIGLVMRGLSHSGQQAALNEVGAAFGLRPTVARPGMFNLKKPGLVGQLEGQEVWIGLSSRRNFNRDQPPIHMVSLRMRVSPGLSTEFSATREGTASRLLQRFGEAEPQVGEEDLDALMHIRTLGDGDREVLQLQSVQNGIFRLVTHLPFEFSEGALTMRDETEDDVMALAGDLLGRARNLAKALAHDTMPTHQDDVWSV